MKAGWWVPALLGAALSVAAIPSHAALVSCTGAFTSDGTAKVHDGSMGNLTAASACEYISPPNNSNTATEENVNLAGFFGTTTWDTFLAKIDLPNGTQSGTWSLAGADFALNDYMIVFKDGDGTNLIGFLFNELFTSGGWDSPFENPPFTELGANQTKDVSHYAIFSRTGDTPPPPPPGQVPEPGSLLLFGFGLAGLAFARRRRWL